MCWRVEGHCWRSSAILSVLPAFYTAVQGSAAIWAEAQLSEVSHPTETMVRSVEDYVQCGWKTPTGGGWAPMTAPKMVT